MRDDRIEFRRALGASASALAFVVVIASLLGPIGAIAHLHGFVTAMCDTLPHLASDLAALVLVVLVASAVSASAFTIGASILLEQRVARMWRPTRDIAKRGRARRVARHAGVTAPIVVFDHDGMMACTRGIARRSIWISDACLDRLDDDELLAVLAHEQHHCERHDPARLMLVGICARSLLAFPIIAVAASRFRCAAEYAADDHARRVAGARATARALLKFADADPAPLLVPFAEPTSIAQRVQRLLGTPRAASSGGASRAALVTLATTIVGTACLTLVVLLPGMA